MDAKTQKYDRQLRLWQANGQKALESAHVLLINASAVGCEILKNLILPGIGKFTILDSNTVTSQDIGSNFFLTLDSLGKSRAEESCALLQELNEDAQGSWLAKDIDNLLVEQPDYLSQFSLVVVTDVSQATAEKVAKICWTNSEMANQASNATSVQTTKEGREVTVERLDPRTSFVWAKTVGLLGTARIAVPEHTIIDAHPDSLADLRLDNPFPELVEYYRTFDFDTTDTLEFAHIPYVAILLRYMEQWRLDPKHDGKLPKDYKEKNELKANIRTGMRGSDDENFDEAINAVLRSCQPTVVPSDIQKLLNDPATENINRTSSDFWIMMRSLRDFVSNKDISGGLLPLSGTIPDMKAQTDSYVTLQQIYKTKAQKDVEALAKFVDFNLESVGREKGEISKEDIQEFAKHSAFLKVTRYNSLEKEYAEPKSKQYEQWLKEDDSVFPYYVLLRASDLFYAEHGRYPGESQGSAWEQDVETLHQVAKTLVTGSWGLEFVNKDGTEIVNKELTHEVCRYGNGSIHNIASLVGGVVSQEIIKLVTHQYIPMENTWVFDGARSVSKVYNV